MILLIISFATMITCIILYKCNKNERMTSGDISPEQELSSLFMRIEVCTVCALGYVTMTILLPPPDFGMEAKEYSIIAKEGNYYWYKDSEQSELRSVKYENVAYVQSEENYALYTVSKPTSSLPYWLFWTYVPKEEKITIYVSEENLENIITKESEYFAFPET